MASTGPASATEYSTFGVKYIGSKKDLLPYISELASKLNTRSAIDVFTGTTRVAQSLRGRGIRTTTSDLSWASTCYANTYVHNADNSQLAEFITRMNALPGEAGWLTQNYTGEEPQTALRSDGRCFQAKNAMRADAARDYIDTLLILPWERHTLITGVIRALDAVDNTVGVQQAYLKEWCKRSFNDIEFKLPYCNTGPISRHYEATASRSTTGSTISPILIHPTAPTPTPPTITSGTA